MLKSSIDRRVSCVLLLAGYMLVAGSARADGESLKGNMRTVDDLNVTPLTLPVKGLPPCLLWADENGSAFLALDGESGLLRRISFPAGVVLKQKDLERKFSWMSLSAEGLLLSEIDGEKIWVVDPDTLELKSKIPVPKLKRAASAPGLSWAIACDRGAFPEQKLYMVDLKRKTAAAWTMPVALKTKLNLDNPIFSPDGASVFTAGNRVYVKEYVPATSKLTSPYYSEYTIDGSLSMFRFSFKAGALRYEENVTARPGSITNANAGISISQDSKLVCMVSQNGDIPDRPFSTAIYEVDKLGKLKCTLDQGPSPHAVGFDVSAGYIYTQNQQHELMVFTLHGIQKKEYSIGRPVGSVLQYLVHPSGHRIVMLTNQFVYFVELPKE